MFNLANEQGLTFWERLLAWYEQSTVYELICYVKERYFSLEFGVYENFSVANELGATVRNIIIAFMLALIVASVMNAYTRQGLGAFVRRLLSEDCLSPDRAKTLSELGYFRSTAIRRALARGTTLRLVVRRVDGEGEATSENAPTETTDDATGDAVCPFEQTVTQAAEGEGGEIDAEMTASDSEGAASNVESTNCVAEQPAADDKIDFLTARFYIPEDLKYRAEIRFRVKGSSWWMVALVSVLGIVIAALLCQLLPDVVAFADNIMTWLSPS